MSNEIFLLEECPTGSCGFGVKGGGGDCDGGNSSCANAKLALPPATVDGQMDAIRQATQRINEKLASLGPGPDDHKLSFLRTPIGVAVGWIRHRPNAEQQPPNPEMIRTEDPRVIGELMIDLRVSPGDETAAGTWEHQVSDSGVVCRRGNTATCWLGPFLVADTNAPYHPPAVRKVVEFMIDELNQLEQYSGGRKLALIKSDDGMMLSWVTLQAQPAPTAA
jgi:hypothetical protein